MLDVGSPCAVGFHLHLNRVVHVLLRDGPDLWRHGGREKQGLLVLWCFVQDQVQIILEAHGEHLICFVQYKELHIVQLQSTTVDEVHRTSRRSDNDLRTALQSTDLRVHVGTAIHGNGLQRHEHREVLHVLGDLQAQFAGWAQYDALYLLGIGVQLMQHGKAECSGLAGTRLGKGNKVLFSAQDLRNGALLNGSRGGETKFVKGLHQFWAQS